ncbi:MAG: FAD-dependent oxidoreductase, partial [Acetobacteraceae bacterium]|nr:FAD-dependent oxidoreductase [Acetobacteraceae bacterium]
MAHISVTSTAIKSAPSKSARPNSAVLPPLDPVRSDTELPAKTSVVVIGGGIIGTSTALFLARKGIPVVLCEKGAIGAE